MLLDCSADAASIPFRDKVINIPFLKQFEAAIQAAASMLSARVRLRSSLVHVCRSCACLECCFCLGAA